MVRVTGPGEFLLRKQTSEETVISHYRQVAFVWSKEFDISMNMSGPVSSDSQFILFLKRGITPGN